MVFRWTTTLLLLVAAVAGCRCPGGRCMPSANIAPCSYERVACVHPAPDLTELAGVAQDDLFLFPIQLPSPSDECRAIDASTCQCNAAHNARVAYMLELEQHWAGELIECESEAVRKAICLTRDLLTLREADVRNQAAGAALTTFYSLAGVETQIHYIDHGIHEARSMIERLDAMRKKGIETPDAIDRAKVSQMLGELEDKRLQLGLARIQFNGQLMRLLGCPLHEEDRFLPRVDWSCKLDRPELDVLAAEGLAHRPDVRSIRLTICRLECETVPVARAVLRLADPALGAVQPQSGLRHIIRCGCSLENEKPIRRRQLCTLLKDSRETATAKIKGVAYEVGIQQQRVALSRQGVLDRRHELRALEKLRDVNDTSIFEISLARSRLFTAEATLVEQVVSLKVAEVTLKQEQGLLVVECGLGAQLCCEPPVSYAVGSSLPAPAACECTGAD